MPRLELNAVEQLYDGTPPVHALRGVSVTIDQGEFVAIEGPSGGGKSSVLNLIGLLDTPSAGTYLIDDVAPATRSAREVAQLRSSVFSFIFQSFHLLDKRPVIDSVELGLVYRAVPRAERRRLATEALEGVGLAHLAHQPSSKLSGGERQRVAIARALASRAHVILADEPTGNLDSANGRAIVASLQRLHKLGSTIVLVTHDPEVATAAPRRLHLRDGLVESSTAKPQGSAAEIVPGETAFAAPQEPPGRPSRVRPIDLIRDALASVWSRKGRTAGLALAVAVGVALAVSTLGLSSSAASQVADTFDAHENREVTVTWMPEPEGAALVTPLLTLDREDVVARLAALAGVTHAAIVSDYDQHLLQRSPERAAETIALYGVTGHGVEAMSLKIEWAPHVAGEVPAGGILLGQNLAQRLEVGPLVASPVILLDGRPVGVVGIITDSNRVPELLGSALVSNEDASFLGRSNRERALVVTRPGAAQQVAHQAPLVINPAEPETLAVEAPVDPRSLRASVESDLQSTLLVLTGVALLASIAGLANAMVLSILERRQEFGLRRAIGARPVHISSLVLLESSVIGAGGGIAGLFSGLAAIIGVTLANHWNPVFDLRLAPLAVVGGVMVGGLGGVLAAGRASRIRPSDALRQ